MSFRRFVVPSLTVVVLACGAFMASAQTGPINGGGTTKSGGQPGGPVAGQQMTAEKLAQVLQGKGHKAEVLTNKDGSKIVRTVIESNGWRYEVDFNVLADGKTMDLSSPLSAAVKSIPQAQLTALMKKNWDLAPQLKFFSLRPSDNRICLENVNYPMPTTEQQLFNILDGHMTTIRNTQDIWDVSRWTNSTGVGN
jgi:hypothetical protein